MTIKISKISEKALIAALVLGDETAFKCLFDDYSGMVFNTALSFHPVKEDAEETVQDVFVEVYKKIESFRAEASLKTWIYRLTISKSLEKIRYSKRKKRWASIISIDSNTEIPEQDGEQNEEENDREEILRKQIETLSENQRIAFTLHHVEGVSYQEVADIMNISLSSVESLIFRAKANLKKKLRTFYHKKS